MKVYLSDTTLTGHHKIYQETLSRLTNTEICNYEKKFVSVRKNPLKAYFDRSKYLNKISKICRGASVHFMYIDSLYKCPLIHLSLKKNNVKFIGTLHWIPIDKFSIYLLKKFAEKLEIVIVHSEFLKLEMINMGIRNVVCIDYPSFIENEKEEIKVEKQDNIIVISCLGGTRCDKGLDLLIESFKYLDNKVKERVIFNICGIEQDIKYKDVIYEADKYSVNYIVRNEFITDYEYCKEVMKSDIILLPYKKNFTGNSGPMTDGIFKDKFIIGPNYGNIGYLIEKYNLGSTFKIEDITSLAGVLNSIVDQDIDKNHKYKEKITIDNFITQNSKVYTSLNNNH